MSEIPIDDPTIPKELSPEEVEKIANDIYQEMLRQTGLHGVIVTHQPDSVKEALKVKFGTSSFEYISDNRPKSDIKKVSFQTKSPEIYYIQTENKENGDKQEYYYHITDINDDLKILNIG